jgi:uncharacterized membrane protein
LLLIFALQLLLAVGYTVLAHLASAWQQPGYALAAMLALVLLLWAQPLWHRRAWAWLSLPLAVAGCWLLYRSGYAMLPLLLVPVAFVLLVAWVFGRSLRQGRTPLITRIVVALDGKPAEAIEPRLLRYTRSLTGSWALVLVVLASLNLVLALIASPGGLLAMLGVASPRTITPEQWSLAANLLNWGLVGGFFLGEYLVRARLFPGRYRSFADFLRKMAGLGPAFWRGFLR